MVGVKLLFITAATVVLVTNFSIEVKSQQAQAKPQSYEYTGTVKTIAEGSHILTIETEKGPLSFHYQRHGKKQCAGFKELAVGDTVKVISAESKKVSEATCINKVSPVKQSK
jgi:hypothetical protein